MLLSLNIPNPPFVPTAVPRGTTLGIVDIARRHDAFLYAGNRIGQDTGYASLSNAVKALRRFTAGEAPAGFVTQSHGKFFTHWMESARAATAPHYGYALGRTWQGERAIKMLPGVLAVVDGAQLLLNNNAATQIGPRALWLRESVL